MLYIKQKSAFKLAYEMRSHDRMIYFESLSHEKQNVSGIHFVAGELYILFYSESSCTQVKRAMMNERHSRNFSNGLLALLL